VLCNRSHYTGKLTYKVSIAQTRITICTILFVYFGIETVIVCVLLKYFEARWQFGRLVVVHHSHFTHRAQHRITTRTFCIFNQPSRLTQPGHPFGVGRMSASEIWRVNRSTTQYTSHVSMISLVSGLGLHKMEINFILWDCRAVKALYFTCTSRLLMCCCVFSCWRV